MFETFEPPKYSIAHIIWNLFLIDKDFLKKVKINDIVNDNNIKYILSILPDENEYRKYIDIDIDHTIMNYDGHNTILDLDAFERACVKIETYRGKRENILIFCNSGYQRSIPFLCYYLMKHHPNEVPDVDRAIDIILPQVDKVGYPELRGKYIESIGKLFETQ